MKTTITLEKYMQHLHIEPGSLFMLGEGSSGRAYQYIDSENGEFRVLKETSSKSEFDFACKIYVMADSNTYTRFAQIFKVAKNAEYFYIVAEYLDTDDYRIYRYYTKFENILTEAELYDILDVSFMTPEQLNHLFFNDVDSQFVEFAKELVYIISDYKVIRADDIHIGNLGYTKDGKLKAFDIDKQDGFKTIAKPQILTNTFK